MGYIVHTSVGGDPVRYTEWVRYNKTSGKCTRCGSCPACYHAHRWTHLKMRNENAHYERWKQVVIYFQKEETSRGGRSRRVGCVCVWGAGGGASAGAPFVTYLHPYVKTPSTSPLQPGGSCALGGVNAPIWNANPAPGNFTELYNRTADPNENLNIANLPEMQAVVARLSAMLHAGWRSSPAFGAL